MARSNVPVITVVIDSAHVGGRALFELVEAATRANPNNVSTAVACTCNRCRFPCILRPTRTAGSAGSNTATMTVVSGNETGRNRIVGVLLDRATMRCPHWPGPSSVNSTDPPRLPTGWSDSWWTSWRNGTWITLSSMSSLARLPIAEPL